MIIIFYLGGGIVIGDLLGHLLLPPIDQLEASDSPVICEVIFREVTFLPSAYSQSIIDAKKTTIGHWCYNDEVNKLVGLT